MNLTIFTIDTDINQKFLKNDSVSKVCLNHLKELIKNNTEHNIEFKIFTPRDRIVQLSMKEFKTYLGLNEIKNSPEVQSDIIKMYILRHLPNHLYIDSDMYFKNLNFLNDLNDKPFSITDSVFAGLWFGQCYSLCEKILNYYREIQEKGFKFVLEKYNFANSPVDKKTYMIDYAVWTNLNLSKDFPTILEKQDNYDKDIMHFDSFRFGPPDNIKFLILPSHLINTVVSTLNTDTINRIKNKNIRLICKDYPWEGNDSNFLFRYVIRYGNAFDSNDDFVKILKDCFPEKPVIYINTIDDLLKEIAP